MKKSVKLNNLFFPLWLIVWFTPAAWLMALPVNFLIDSAVIIISMKLMGITETGKSYRKSILRTWLLGFAADFTGTLLLFIFCLIDSGSKWFNSVQNGVFLNPFNNIFSFLTVAVCCAVSAVCIYIFNSKYCLKNAELTEKQVKKLRVLLSFFYFYE